MTPSAAKRNLWRLARAIVAIYLFGLHTGFLWDNAWACFRHSIENDRDIPGFGIVVVRPTNAELHFMREDLEEFLNEHTDYSFLIPAGGEKEVEAQIIASREQKCPTCVGVPSLSVTRIGPDHQLIEVYLHGDPHDNVYWYEATDKKIVPQYQMTLSIPHAFLIEILAVLLIAGEYFVAKWLAGLAARWLLKPPALTPSL